MRITGFESNEAILLELGQRIKDTRISMNYTQDELAQLAGVSAITLSRLERGKSVSMENMIRC